MKLPAGYVPGEGIYKATAYGGLGERLLKRMGWEEGRGLGINQDGMKKAIEVKRKEDQTGVGGKAGFAWEKKWWEEAYESKLQKLQTEDSDSDSSGDELTTYINRDGTRSSATAAELKMAAELSKDPWGRFGGRAGKMARIRAQEAETLAAMQSKLTGSSTAGADSVGNSLPGRGSTNKNRASIEEDVKAVSAGQMEKAKGARHESRVNGSMEPSAAPSAKQGVAGGAAKKRERLRSEAIEAPAAIGGAVKEGQGPKKKARVVHVVSAGEAPSLAAFRATPRSGWWGARRFASAGCLEGLEHTADLVARQRQTFTEQTQEDLYMSAHAGKSASKKGLGSAAAPRNVGGTSWKGQKTVFADDVHATEGAAPEGADVAAQPPVSTEDQSAASSIKKAKWKKIARCLLEQVEENYMTTGQLQRKALKQVLHGQKASKQTRTEAREILMNRLQGSKGFILYDDRISLNVQK